MSGFRLTSQKIRLSENDVERACLDLLRVNGYPTLRLHSGGFRTKDNRWITVGEPGLPDYCIPAWFLEVKRPGGKLSDKQQLKIMELERSWYTPVAVIERVEDLHEWLAAHPSIRPPFERV